MTFIIYIYSEVVLKNDKILLYSCPRKMELVKKGYSKC